MENKDLNFDNSNLLKLIDEWVQADGKGETYEKVMNELFNGNSCLFVQTHGEQVNETRTFVTDGNSSFQLGVYIIDGKKFLGAFTELCLLVKWLKARCSYLQLPSKALLEMADKTKMDGIIINNSYRNMFVAFRK